MSKIPPHEGPYFSVWLLAKSAISPPIFENFPSFLLPQPLPPSLTSEPKSAGVGPAPSCPVSTPLRWMIANLRILLC